MQAEMFSSFLSSPRCAQSLCQNKEWVCQVGPLIRRPHTFFLEMPSRSAGCEAGPCARGAHTAEAAVMALLENNLLFPLCAWILVCALSFPNCWPLLASGNYNGKDYSSSIAAFESSVRHYIFKPI